MRGASWWYAQELWRFFQVGPTTSPQPYAAVSNGRRRHASLIALRILAAYHIATYTCHNRPHLTNIPDSSLVSSLIGSSTENAVVSEQEVP